MHPETAKTLAAMRRGELTRQMADSRRAGRRLFPRWQVSWSRMTLPPAAAEQAQAATGGSSLIIIISAHRSA